MARRGGRVLAMSSRCIIPLLYLFLYLLDREVFHMVTWLGCFWVGVAVATRYGPLGFVKITVGVVGCAEAGRWCAEAMSTVTLPYTCGFEWSEGHAPMRQWYSGECTVTGRAHGVGAVTSVFGVATGEFRGGRRVGVHAMQFYDGSVARGQFSSLSPVVRGVYSGSRDDLDIEYTYLHGMAIGEWAVHHEGKKIVLEFAGGRARGGVVEERDGARYDAAVSCRALNSALYTVPPPRSFSRAYGRVVLNDLMAYNPTASCKSFPLGQLITELLDNGMFVW
jgi:hypothetical protein